LILVGFVAVLVGFTLDPHHSINCNKACGALHLAPTLRRISSGAARRQLGTPGMDRYRMQLPINKGQRPETFIEPENHPKNQGAAPRNIDSHLEM